MWGLEMKGIPWKKIQKYKDKIHRCACAHTHRCTHTKQGYMTNLRGSIADE